MVRKATKRSSSRKRKAAEKRSAKVTSKVHVTIKLRDISEVPTYYVNYLDVGHSAYEFAITAAKAPTRLDDATRSQLAKDGVLELEPLLQLLVPPKVIPGLIDALVKQLTAYGQVFPETSNLSPGEKNAKSKGRK